MNKGKIYLVGAGPGDPELITLKADSLIQKADVILYDSLVSPLLLSNKRDDAIVHYCGKRGGKASFPQDEINDLLVKYGREGKMVVRLKGGDPWLFSRGAEEAEILAENGIPFEIVPGVTSPIAATAYAGIPISHRDHSSSIVIATGHPRSGRSIDELGVPSADTTIYLMAVENLAEITEKLISSGKPRDLPAALIQNGTTGRQRTVIGDLGSITMIAKKENIKAPAIFITGEVVKLKDRLSWFEQLPLFGKRLVLTRSVGQANDTVMKLSRLGADVIYYPTIRIEETTETKDLFDRANALASCTDIIFTSGNGVKIFFKHLHNKRLDTRVFAGKRIFAIGKNTAGALDRYGIIPDMVPNEFTSEGVLEMLPKDLSGRNFLLPRASEATPTLEEGLMSRGALVTKIILYTIKKPTAESNIPLEAEHINGVIFTSAMTANNFFDMTTWPTGAVAFCIGKTTATALKGKDAKIVISPEATIDSLIDTIIEHYQKR